MIAHTRARRADEERVGQRPLQRVAKQRLTNQRLIGVPLRRPADVVGWFGAIQAQEYEAAKWAIALRLNRATDAAIQRAIDEGRILRTHVMRPTWHFVRREDLRWLIALTAPRVQQAIAYHGRFVELDRPTLVRGTTLIERAIGREGCLTRRELRQHLAAAGMSVAGQRLAHLVMHAELEAVICSGPRREKQFTYALLADRAPASEPISRDAALARLCLRYFASHGPATVRDFAWWSGLTIADGKRGLDMIRARSKTIDGLTYWTTSRVRSPAADDRPVHLLPIYDEYLVAYRDRIAVPQPTLFRNSLVVAGQMAGGWRAVANRGVVAVNIMPTRGLSAREMRAAERAAAGYAAFANGGVARRRWPR